MLSLSVMNDGFDVDDVMALAVWEGQMISGHNSWSVRVWDVSTGKLRQELGGHSSRVCSLCVVGSRLASGSDDRRTNTCIKVWAIGAGSEWRCDDILTGHTGGVVSLAGWEGKLISGSDDSTIRVWELETGRLDATLTGHRGSVRGLLVHGARLFILVWSLGRGSAVWLTAGGGGGAGT